MHVRLCSTLACSLNSFLPSPPPLSPSPPPPSTSLSLSLSLSLSHWTVVEHVSCADGSESPRPEQSQVHSFWSCTRWTFRQQVMRKKMNLILCQALACLLRISKGRFVLFATPSFTARLIFRQIPNVYWHVLVCLINAWWSALSRATQSCHRIPLYFTSGLVLSTVPCNHSVNVFTWYACYEVEMTKTRMYPLEMFVKNFQCAGSFFHVSCLTRPPFFPPTLSFPLFSSLVLLSSLVLAPSFMDMINFARSHDFDSFLAVGGGSVMDTAKVGNLYQCYPEAEFLDFVNAPLGKGLPVLKTLKPLIASRWT